MRVIEYRCQKSRGRGQACRRHLATVTIDDLGEVTYEQGPHGALAEHDPARPNLVREFLDEFDYVGNPLGPHAPLRGLVDVLCDRHGYVATIWGASMEGRGQGANHSEPESRVVTQ